MSIRVPFLLIISFILFVEFYETTGELKLNEELDWIFPEKNKYNTCTDNSTLCFPGKISWDPAGKRLAISDTGQHRILITDSQGVVQVS